MASNQRPNYFGQKALPYGAQPFYPPSHYPPNWWSMSPPQDMVYPQMWSQNNPYFRPHMNYGPNDHSIDCCLSPNNRNGCQQTTSLCSNCRQSDDVSNDMIVINEIRDHSMLLESSLEDMTRKLRETKLNSLEANERQAINAIEVRQKLLDQMSDQIQHYCRLFKNNSSIVKDCMELLDEIYVYLVKTNEIKQRVVTQVLDKKSKINENVGEDYDLSVIEDQMSSDLPDLSAFYKTLIDKISQPLVDVSVPSVEVKNVTIDGDVDQEDIRPSLLNLGLVDDNICATSVDTTDDLFSQESKVGQTFGNDKHPIIELPFTMTSDTKQQIEDLIELKEDSKIVTEQNLLLNTSTSNESVVTTQMDSSPSLSSNDKTFATISNPNLTLNESKLIGNPLHQKIVDKLKAIFPNISEELLFNSMVSTKELFIKFGQKKGFTGMKVCDIVTAVSQYIDSESLKTEDMPSNGDTENYGINGFGGDTEMCGICYKVIAHKSDNQTLSCEHPFHFKCLEEWAQTNNRCPNCRQLI